MLIKYFDNTGRIKIDSRVLEAMSLYLNDFVGNASSKVLTKIHLNQRIGLSATADRKFNDIGNKTDSSIKDYFFATRNFLFLNH